jgi:PAS domain S-box-containing protein
MKRRVGFLETELEQAIAARRARTESSNIVELNLQSDSPWQERERRFRELLDALPAAIYTTDAAGRLTYFNEHAVDLWGQRPELNSSGWHKSWRLFAIDGSPLPYEKSPMAIALQEDRAVRGIEAIGERPDGSKVPFLPYPTPLHDQTGVVVGAVNMLVDISERQRSEDQQMMLLREVHHRVRNTLAIAQAIVGSTAKTSETIEDFKESLIGRISALARTHLLMADGNRSVSFESMLRSELDAFDDASGLRIVLNGPEVHISTRHAVPLGMVLHELTTNSAKYGALSALGGCVDVEWRVVTDGDLRRLEFEWIESGGPAVAAPARKGFGAQLLDTVLPRQINAETRIDFHPDGLRVHIAMPLPPETTRS